MTDTQTDAQQDTQRTASDRFVVHLDKLNPNKNPTANRKALAELRRSLSFDLGTHIPAYPYVEPFVEYIDSGWKHDMYYLVAGLYATYPDASVQPGDFGKAMADLARERDSESLERRFLAMLAAEDRGQLAYHLRQLVSLLKAESISLNYARLLRDLWAWRHPDRYVQRRWAQSYYRTPRSDTETKD